MPAPCAFHKNILLDRFHPIHTAVNELLMPCWRGILGMSSNMKGCKNPSFPQAPSYLRCRGCKRYPYARAPQHITTAVRIAKAAPLHASWSALQQQILDPEHKLLLPVQ